METDELCIKCMMERAAKAEFAFTGRIRARARRRQRRSGSGEARVNANSLESTADEGKSFRLKIQIEI